MSVRWASFQDQAQFIVDDVGELAFALEARGYLAR